MLVHASNELYAVVVQHRAWAVKTLMKLIDNTAMPEPRVRDLYPAAPAPAVTVATAQQARLAFSQQTSARRDAAFNLNSAYGYEGPTGAALPDSRYPPKHQPLLPQVCLALVLHCSVCHCNVCVIHKCDSFTHCRVCGAGGLYTRRLGARSR